MNRFLTVPIYIYDIYGLGKHATYSLIRSDNVHWRVADVYHMQLRTSKIENYKKSEKSRNYIGKIQKIVNIPAEKVQFCDAQQRGWALTYARQHWRHGHTYSTVLSERESSSVKASHLNKKWDEIRSQITALIQIDPDVCRIASTMLRIHYLVGVGHVAECR